MTYLSFFKTKGLSTFVAGIGLLIVFGYFLSGALFPLLLAWAFAYLLIPVVSFLERKGCSASVARWSVYLVTLMLLGVVFFVIVPRLVVEGISLIQHLPMVLQESMETLRRVLLSLNIPGVKEEYLQTFLRKQVSLGSLDTSAPFSGLLNTAGSRLLSIVLSIANYALFPVFFYYMLLYFGSLKSFFWHWIPAPWRPKADALLTISDQVMSGYARGQVIVASSLAVLYAIGLGIVGLKYGIAIGIVTGLLNVVPYFGFSIGLVAGILVALFSGKGLPHVGAVLAVFTCVQMLESFVLTPRIVGHHVGLNPFLALLALIVGGNMLGIVGMVLAVPLAAIFKVGYDTWTEKMG